jgi:hypothetical protein
MSNRDHYITISVMVVLLGLLMALLIGDGCLNAWSEQKFNGTVVAAVNPYTINYYINGTVIMEDYPLGFSGMWLGRIYIFGFSCILTAGLLAIGGQCRRQKVPFKIMFIPSGFGSMCLSASLIIWVPIQQEWNSEFTLTVNWFKLILLAGMSLISHLVAGIMHCQMTAITQYDTDFSIDS